MEGIPEKKESLATQLVTDQKFSQGMRLSVIICTHNRFELVKECVQSLLNQTVEKTAYEVVVVDNASTDETPKIKDVFRDIKYLREENVGLSYARNCGYRHAVSDWVNYIDDDALAHPDYVEKNLETIDKYKWDCFGGIFLPWFKYGKPKWYPETFGTNKFDFDGIGILPDSKSACGGVLTIRKDLLEFS